MKAVIFNFTVLVLGIKLVHYNLLFLYNFMRISFNESGYNLYINVGLHEPHIYIATILLQMCMLTES